MVTLLIEILSGTVEIIISGLAPLLLWTGEIVLYILTFGYRRPQFKFQEETWKAYFLPFNYLSFWFGLAVWVIGPILLYKQFGN